MDNNRNLEHRLIGEADDAVYGSIASGSEVSILALTANVILKDAFKDLLARGCRVRLLISGGLSTALWAHGVSKEKSDAWTRNLQRLPDTLATLRASEGGHRLVVHYVDWVPSCSMIIHGSPPRVHLSYYTPDPQASSKARLLIDLPQTEVEKCGAFNEQFETLWRRSTPVTTDGPGFLSVLHDEAEKQFGEVQLSLPHPATTDVAFIIALPEELRAFLDVMCGASIPEPRLVSGQYVFEFVVGGRKCVAAVLGRMGRTGAAMVTERLAHLYRVRLLVSIGITGAAKSTVFANDVLIASQVTDYAHRSKAGPGDEGYQIVLGGQAFQTTSRVHDCVMHFPFLHPSAFRQWELDCRSAAEATLGDSPVVTDQHESTVAAVRRRAGLSDDSPLTMRDAAMLFPRVRLTPRLFVDDVHVASGDIVASDRRFLQWLQEHDRNLMGVEMESAGLMYSAHFQHRRVETLVVRAISDLADVEKSSLESIFGDRMRTISMQNATRLIKTMLESDCLFFGAARDR